MDAVVLRIDSGGGDVVASDTIADAIRWCQDVKNKPVVVSFGNTSASGGYYVSTHAKAIVAQRRLFSVFLTSLKHLLLTGTVDSSRCSSMD